MLNENIINADIINDFCEILLEMYKNGWSERNGGNISLIIDDNIINKYIKDSKLGIETKLPFKTKELANKYLLVTGKGKYFRHIAKKNKTKYNAGIVKMNNEGGAFNTVWGFEKGSEPTSELPSHLLSHAARLNKNPKHSVVIHSHPTTIVSLTFTEELNEKSFTKIMWKMISEASFVFSEGIGILPWMVPGSNEIGIETAKKMNNYRSVIWAHHGIFCSGETLDEAFGLLECIEKSAKIYQNILSTNKKIIQEITDIELITMSKHFGYNLNKKILDKGE
ncbi:rhamnulose-1-phosphate aldolase [Spiroplasma endosymbiont of Aspidapion aeneum]|uniref:rhamnulose-1-phosphate aldolase n=1 Tax=Spiroplasma endosymbiont of Aspidapion aeneum TaxID=3066276 RepID=UPI00313D3B2C